MQTTRNLFGLLLLPLALAGCTHGAYTRAAIGRLTLSVRPQSLKGVKRAVLELSGLQLERAGAGALTYDFRPPRVVMLAPNSIGNDNVLLNRQTLPAGTYTGVRLLLDPSQHGVDSFAELPGGGLQVLESPHDGREYLAVDGSFTVPSSGRRRLVLRISLAKGLSNGHSKPASIVPSLHLADISGGNPSSLQQQDAS